MSSNTSYKRSVISCFEQCVQHHPYAVALTYRQHQYTYQELNDKINQFAHCLALKGVGASDFVTILLEPSADFILSILAVIKLGAVYVPLDIQAPKSRLEDIINDAQPKLIITEEHYQSLLGDLEYPIGLIKRLHLESVSHSKENINTTINPLAPLYMIYTSGSTGRPKGVIIPHCAVVNLAVVENYANVAANEVVAQFNTPAFDASTFEIWSALLNSACLAIIPLHARTNYIELKEELKQHHIQYFLVPTGFFHQLIKSAPDTLNPVHTVLYGGEQINPHLLKDFIHFRNHIQRPIRLINGYGPSEGTTFACRHQVDEHQMDNLDELASIGQGFTNATIYVLDEHLNPVDEGELYISGIHLALGYHNSPTLTQERFISNPWNTEEPFERLYKTGDLVKKLPSGNLLYTGRVDDQVKVGGFRIHLSEIERQLMTHEHISLASVIVEIGGGMHKMLTAYIVFSSPEHLLRADEIRTFLSHELPAYMLPAKYVMVDELPLTLIGKVDKSKLEHLPHTDLSFHTDTSSASIVEETIKDIWKHLLNRKSLSTQINLFDLGANSLLITEACTQINNELHTDLQITDLLAHPTIHKLSRFIEGDMDVPRMREHHPTSSLDIAIVGMSCRLPQANTLEAFWDNLCSGRDCLTRFPYQDSTPIPQADHWVPVRGIIDKCDEFDASFFNYSPADANHTDPQQRIFLECVWEALEQACVRPSSLNQTISVFAGMTDSTYLHENLLKNTAFCASSDFFQQRLVTSTSMLSTQISYRLDLTGRSINVNTACSTGLIAVDHACQELIQGQCDVAIAGTSSIVVPQNQGYAYQRGSIVSSDGFCRPFSKDANGTVFSNGVGVVVLKRLHDAIHDKDTIYAVIKARGVNNDGQDKLGFTAPSVSGQQRCIQEALNQAQIPMDKIGLVEAHGTATALGDVIEFSALTQAYRVYTDKKQFCALGSVKSIIGHTDVTAGIAGLIKTALCLYHRKIPPMAHFEAPNPELHLEQSPFYVNTKLIDWESPHPRYAGVSSFGVGGTNIHMILSDYLTNPGDSYDEAQEELFFLSAKTSKALDTQAQQLIDYVHHSTYKPELFPHIAYTLHTGREAFAWRRYVVASNHKELIERLKHGLGAFCDEEVHHSVVFMFSGQGTQYPLMANELFQTIPRFRELVLLGVEYSAPYLHSNLLEIILNPATELLHQTQWAQPALFIIEYALARLLMDCGIRPDSLMGHSIGEYVAACLAGVFSFEDGVALVCERGILMGNAPKGAMLALQCTNEECAEYVHIAPVDIALHNAKNHYVLSGSIEAITRLEAHLNTVKQPAHRLKVSHAFHSRLMDHLEEPFKEMFAHITLSPPTIPIVSNLTGTWLTAQEATNPDYWYQHARHTVRLAESIACLLEDEHPLFVEIGLGQALGHFVQETASHKVTAISTLPNHQRRTSDRAHLLNALGELWTKGVTITLESLYSSSQQHIPLPTYPFQRRRYWTAPDTSPGDSLHAPRLFQPTWTRTPLHIKPEAAIKESTWVIFKDHLSISHHLIQTLRSLGAEPIVITKGDEWCSLSRAEITINPTHALDYERLVNALTVHSTTLNIIHCWSLDNEESLEDTLNIGLYSLMYWTQACTQRLDSQISVRGTIVTRNAVSILGTESVAPIQATLLGLCRVIGFEHPSYFFQLMDIEPLSDTLPHNVQMDLINRLVLPLPTESLSAYRNGVRWHYGQVPVHDLVRHKRLIDKGVYLITGGLGGIGLTLAHVIAQEVREPTLILCSRTDCPDESQWETIVQDETHPKAMLIKQLITLKIHGALIDCRSIDVTCAHDLHVLMTSIEQSYGRINGLIHAAGIAGEGLIQLKTKNKADMVLAPKVQGTYYLAKASQQIAPLDFVVLMSSIASLTGAPGQIDYCAANACLDAFAYTTLFNTDYCCTINWPAWREVGMSVTTLHSDKLDLFTLNNDITPREGQQLFLQSLYSSLPQVIVSSMEPYHYKEQLLTRETPHHEEYIARNELPLKSNYEAPKDALEKQLACLWQECLHIECVGRLDDFFQLGGHSLTALTLIERINKRCACSLSIQHLYTAPTIAALAQYISFENKQTVVGTVVPLGAFNTPGRAVFFCHPISGLVQCFNELIAHWKKPASLYGLQDISISEGQFLYDSIQDMAAQYVKAIQQIQPHGPYSLVGYSFGGAVVYEMAHLLRQQGEVITLLVLIDSWCVFSEAQQQEHHFMNHALEHHITPQLLPLALARHRLLINYRPTHTTQEMVLFKAHQLDEEYQKVDDPYNGWSTVNKGTIHCHTIEANHVTIMDAEAIQEISGWIQNQLE